MSTERWRNGLERLGAIPPPVHVSLIALAAYAELHALGPVLGDSSVAARDRPLAYLQATCAGIAVLGLIWSLLGRRTAEQRLSGGVAWVVVIAATIAWVGFYLARRATVG
jgi:formate-dependent nitrite reductase membrane component NrfD